MIVDDVVDLELLAMVSASLTSVDSQRRSIAQPTTYLENRSNTAQQ